MGEKSSWIRCALVIVSYLVIAGGFFAWYKWTEPKSSEDSKFSGVGIFHKKGYYTPRECIATVHAVDPDMPAADPGQRMVYKVEGGEDRVYYDGTQHCLIVQRPIYPSDKKKNSINFPIIAASRWNNSEKTKNYKIEMTINLVGGVDETEEFFQLDNFAVRKNNLTQTNIFNFKPINTGKDKSAKYEIAEFAEDFVKKFVKIIDETKINVTVNFTEYSGNQFTVPIAIVNAGTEERTVRNLIVCIFDDKNVKEIEFFNNNYHMDLSKNNPPKKGDKILNVLAMSNGIGSVSYEITSDDRTIFTIDKDSGRITLLTEKALDKEEYELKVRGIIADTPSKYVETIVKIKNKW